MLVVQGWNASPLNLEQHLLQALQQRVCARAAAGCSLRSWRTAVVGVGMRHGCGNIKAAGSFGSPDFSHSAEQGSHSQTRNKVSGCGCQHGCFDGCDMLLLSLAGQFHVLVCEHLVLQGTDAAVHALPHGAQPQGLPSPLTLKHQKHVCSGQQQGCSH